jgi:octaprenyl-diphosphate synthase
MRAVSARAGMAATSDRAVRPGLKALFAPIAEPLARVDEIYARALRSPSPHVARLVEHAGLFRGKQLRPAFVLLAGRACGRLTEAHVAIGAIVEMIHTATLLHDDVLDHATTRRSVPSVNSLHGNEVPILLGDFIYAQAYSLANRIEDRTAALELADATQRLCTGEIDQDCERGRVDLTAEEYFRIIEDKTAALFAVSARLGAHYAGADAATTAALAEYGRRIGIAFQIVDDCLDLAGDEEKAGKSLGTDLAERKTTLPLIRLLERVPDPVAKAVRRLLAEPARAGARDALRAIVDFSPDVAAARADAREHVDAALRQIAGLPDSDAKRALATIGGFVLERDR